MNYQAFTLALSLCLAVAPWSIAGASAQQSALNRYRVEFVRTYGLDFEAGANPVVALTTGVTLTTNAAEVVAGGRLLKLDGASVYAQLNPAAVALQAGRFYLVELRYRMLRQGRVGLVLRSPGAVDEFLMLGELPLSPIEGSLSVSVQVPQVAGATLLFYSIGAAVTLDDIHIDAQTPKASRATLPLITAGFPRLGDYMLLSPATIASMHGQDPAAAERVAARFDLLVGSGFDHTRGAAAWIRSVRTLNPSLLVLPYRQAFMAQYEGNTGLQAAFNAGLDDAWFMRSTTSTRLAEPYFPQNVQLDHTAYAPAVDGVTLADYSTSFLSQRVLPSGLWDGVQFDQAEWYVNPLLGSPPPPIDLDRNGAADSYGFLQREWSLGFSKYFQTVKRQFGFTQLLVGNAGYLSSNPTALSTLNGWIAEHAAPYPSDAAGNWLTAYGAGWYRLVNNYLLAGRIARAPQLPMLQFTGAGLGQPTGGVTPNGAPMRTSDLVAADYRRMRLGLATALLGNGFFEYDLVDNTTPALWFDEHAVNASGTAVPLASGKGYLGQPLGDAEELAYASRTIFNLDFETPALPASTYVNGRIGTSPAEVISGTRSLVVTKASAFEFAWFVWAGGQIVPGRSYQLRADYKTVSVQPTTHQGLLGIGFADASGLPTHRTGSLFMPDVDGPGQQGTLRASIKASSADQVLGMLFDLGTVAIDNVQLVEGTGGVWRRDFENGVVLVNPTSEPILVSLAQVNGPRSRTGVRRILGTQQPAWNNGQPVTSGGVVIPSGDGIVLLANRIAATAPAAPGAPVLTSAGTSMTATWSPAAGYPAGYQITYGEDSAHLTRVAAAGRDARLTLDDLRPGATYYFQVAAYDFRGTIGPASAIRSVVVPGSEGSTRPNFSLYSTALVPGAITILAGTALADATTQPTAPYPTQAAGTRVEVNGIDAPLYWVSPTAIAFIAPWEVVGQDAVLNVIRGNAPGRERIVPMRAALPQLIESNTPGTVLAMHTNGARVSATAPARRGETIDIMALGLGAVTLAPHNGAPPVSGSIATPVATPVVTIGSTTAALIDVRLDPALVGVYRIAITIPASMPIGAQQVRIRVAGEDSNILTIPIQQ